MIPPIVPLALSPDNAIEDLTVAKIIKRILDDTESTKDNLIKAKVLQATYVNCHCKQDFTLNVRNCVLLCTFHHQYDYKNSDKNCIAKFMPRFDSPFLVTGSNPNLSWYTLEIPNSPAKFNTFHVSELRPFIANDLDLFPSQEHPHPGPILTED